MLQVKQTTGVPFCHMARAGYQAGPRATILRMRRVALGGAVCAASAMLAYAVRGRSSALLAPSVYRGSRSRRAIALTFDDGPSESTGRLLDLLHRLGIPATFFVCGM